MLKETSENLKLGAIVKVSLGGSLDGHKCIANGPLVLMDGDEGEVVHDSRFPTWTQQGIAQVRKYVVQFHGLGGIRMLLSPEELERPFELVKQGDRDAGPPPSPAG